MINEHTPQRVILIGHSMGAQFVYWVAKMLKQDLLSLCITIEGTLWGPQFVWINKPLKPLPTDPKKLREKYIFQQVMKHKDKQIEPFPFPCPVISFWNESDDQDRNRIRQEHDKFWNHNESHMFRNLGHFMHEMKDPEFERMLLIYLIHRLKH